MTNVIPGAIPAGWYPDPAGSPRSRWWDGAQWTDNYQEPYTQAAAGAPLMTAPAGTVTNTPWIWLIALLPIVPILGLLTIDWSSMFAGDLSNPETMYAAQFAIFLSPGYILTLVGSWIVYGLNVLFAYLDWKELTKRGVPRPFHWAWTFLSSLVYVIGRSVVVRRRTGAGFAPFWAAMGYIVVSFVVVIVMMVQMFAAIAQVVEQYR